MSEDQNRYDDIINAERHVSSLHRHMSNAERAAQFAPFAALTGYEEALREASRLTREKIELSSWQKEILNGKITRLLSCPAEVTVIFFVKDTRKEGGSYLHKTGIIKTFDEAAGELVMKDKTRISADDVLDIVSDDM